MTDRLSQTFIRLQAENKGAFISFMSAGDPDYETSLRLLLESPNNGADIIELGMPFSDPMVDGPTIQASSLRALQHGQNMHKTMAMVKAFRATNDTTPIILMGYYNPIYRYGKEQFLRDCQEYGVDGLLIVDLPMEEDDELRALAMQANIHFIRIIAPTTGDARMEAILHDVSGFIYYTSILGITGGAHVNIENATRDIARIRQYTDVPVVVGFGITTQEHVRNTVAIADGAVVGSHLVNIIGEHAKEHATQDNIADAFGQALRHLSAATSRI